MKYVLFVIYNINYRNVSFGIILYICICEIVYVNIFNWYGIFYLGLELVDRVGVDVFGYVFIKK